MRKIYGIAMLFLVLMACKKEEKEKLIYTQDVDNYWKAYDKITSTKDSVLQSKYLKEEFLDKASIGQKTMFKVRNCTPQEYIENINDYPKFWNSIKENTIKSKGLSSEIDNGLQKLKQIYPDLKPAKVYFTVGAFRTGGTAVDSLVIFGVDMQMLDENINTSELKKSLDNVKKFQKTNPINNVKFTGVHEFVHTQQKPFSTESLLVASLYEGVAEFVAEKALGEKSSMEGIEYGKKNTQVIKDQFEIEMFNKAYSYWLWSSMSNKFNQRDLGYFIGYKIAEKYYDDFDKDKNLAIKNLIELDYGNNETIIEFVDSVKFFDKPISEIRKENEKHRPYVVSIKEFKNNDTDVDPAIKTLTIEFSKPMNEKIMNLRLGPLGESNLLSVTSFKGWSEDRTKLFYEIELKPKLKQQILVTDFYQSKEGYPLQPYLIDITTK
ncbi:hypothetical protein ABMY20_03400 [Tenacibaculum sp. SSH1-16]|uniref:hypothetical protein n=1 Tax=Tenacibaculum sp. SSH1-16 TaxID=3136667 RepID=UPI0032C43D49|nr:hypothetical protein BACT7_06190 [Tenacibaculum mesophilum]